MRSVHIWFYHLYALPRTPESPSLSHHSTYPHLCATWTITRIVVQVERGKLFEMSTLNISFKMINQLLSLNVYCTRPELIATLFYSSLQDADVFIWLLFNFYLNCNIIFSVLSIFKRNSGKTSDKLIAFRSFLSSDIIPTSSKEKESDELLYTVLVTRYGPRSVANARGWH